MLWIGKEPQTPMVKASDLTGWLDYDRKTNGLAGLDDAERIAYFEKRVRLVTINPLKRILDHEVFLPHESPPTSAVLIFGVSICCAIEATGKFLTGDMNRSGNTKRFHAFLNRYMDSRFQTQKVGPLTFGDALWFHFRNGIAHGYAVCHGGFEGTPQEPYFKTVQIAGHESLKVNPTLFFNDFTTAFDRYLLDLRTVPPTDSLSVNFKKVFEGVFIRGD